MNTMPPDQTHSPCATELNVNDPSSLTRTLGAGDPTALKNAASRMLLLIPFAKIANAPPGTPLVNRPMTGCGLPSSLVADCPSRVSPNVLESS